MERYIFEKSKERENWYVVTDLTYNIVVRFEVHKFNDTQKVTVLDDKPRHTAQDYATAMRELGDWMVANHYDLIF